MRIDQLGQVMELSIHLEALEQHKKVLELELQKQAQRDYEPTSIYRFSLYEIKVTGESRRKINTILLAATVQQIAETREKLKAFGVTFPDPETPKAEAA